MLDAIGEIARHDQQVVVVSAGDKDRQTRFANLGLYRATGWRRSPWIHIPPDRAVKMNAEASVSATDHAENAGTTNPRPED